MKVLEPGMMRLMMRAALFLCAGLLLLLLASSGWLGHEGWILQLALMGAIAMNAAAAWYFLRYFLSAVQDIWRK
ncbi:hypothetical protein JCM17846_14240 [Iodidimonas nitroreducens]|uniref:Uncharacterized protein n=2 Tax=Iodidimonas TaxID=2066486 RepID=A0A5A7N5Z7_9PROT|nr:hypothetical protein [Iodidimonas nitroreducens]GAK33569.1 hypothetical protein AQ1_01459 [alpha proteobacterium Q-1]GER03742.1 hypothetical protein JCM17846_14240 [Iodidimonas nitroreducens]